ncbi:MULTISPECIES: right-handed parallel beta-helix repeat-containing protein [Cyanophyceae]|uniref:right-handed parallel beta-helix repeat-containing protein n=1 Tax=Cyanophyceae TaxID=3028117 RepID=UPI0016836FE9|nr:right-handed parallel beta-helix repeat-containing protein [Trichocoleus sp. FACHB-69]MBD1933471.1 right-handed parallel beta-helix repeat-containing protein [Trichocoleus sp. FACHB-69]
MSKLSPLVYISWLLLVTLTLATSKTVNAQTEPSTETAKDNPPFFTPRLGINYTTSGAGFDDFASFEGFIPLLQNPGNSLTFLEGQLLWSINDSTLGGNLLLGHRFYSSSDDRIIGGYIAYDNRNTGLANFNQLGAGFESLGQNWDVRANVYIPVGDTRQQVKEDIFDTGVVLQDTFFAGNYLNFHSLRSRQILRQYQVAMAGFDIEAGAKIAQLGATGDIRGYAGLYYYDAPGSAEILGWRTRLAVRPSDTLSLGLSVQNDATFGTNLVLSLAASFPARRLKDSSSHQVLARMNQSVARQANILVDRQSESEWLTESFTVQATNPKTNNPYFFEHVNLGAGGGDGTFERPYGTLQDALNVAGAENIVYVQPGTNSGIGSFTVPDGVQLLSTGPVQQLDTIQQASVLLPLSGASVLPQVRGTVTLGDNTTISGFYVDSPGTQAISGRNLSNVTIRDNLVTNALGEGIFLENAIGRVRIINNTVKGTTNGTTVPIRFTGNVESGIFIRNNIGPVDLTISGNTVEDNPSPSAIDGIEVSICLNFEPCSSPVQGTVQILNNTIRNLGNFSDSSGGVSTSSSGVRTDGIDINIGNNAQIVPLTISGNTLDNISDSGITLAFNGDSQAIATVSNNVLRKVADHGVSIVIQGATLGLGTIPSVDSSIQGTPKVQITVSANTIDTTGTEGIRFKTHENSVSTTTITNNTISNTAIGINAEFKDRTLSTTTITNNTISNSVDKGINIETKDSSQLRALIESNMVINVGSDGIRILDRNKDASNSQVFAGVRLNALTSNDFKAIVSNNAKLCLQLLSNTSNSDFKLTQTDYSTFQVENALLGTNTGTMNPKGTFTNVPQGACGFP